MCYTELNFARKSAVRGGVFKTMLNGKTVLLGVSGGIAAYKSASLASLLDNCTGADEVTQQFRAMAEELKKKIAA